MAGASSLQNIQHSVHAWGHHAHTRTAPTLPRGTWPRVSHVGRHVRTLAPGSTASRRLRCPASTANGQGTGPVRLTGNCYEDIIATLAQRAIRAMQQLPPDAKHIVGIAGGPGSGKSTLAAAVKAEVNRQMGADVAVLLPMDGFHLYRRELDQFPDPAAARARRGAHWTFNAPALVAAVARVRREGRARVPSFDHGKGDPVEEDIHITRQHRIVLVEGLYLLLDMEPWNSLQPLFDDTWFVDVDIDTAMERVYRRQTSHGVAPEVSRQRITGNDRPNGELVNQLSPGKAAVIVPSDIPFANASQNAVPL